MLDSADNSQNVIFPPPDPGSSGSSQRDRWLSGAWVFRDETLRRLEFLLDEAFRVPGTGIRFGMDGIIGLVPGLGDVIAGLLSLVIPIAAWMRGIPYVALVRMLVNLGIGVLIGSIPLFGDLFDIAWKPNRRNYQLLQRHLGEPRRHNWRDWGFLTLLAAAMAIVFAIPLILFLCLVAHPALTTGPRFGDTALSRITVVSLYNRRSCRGVAQSGSASALGAEGRGFKSLRPDHGISNLQHSYPHQKIHCSENCSECLSFPNLSRQQIKAFLETPIPSMLFL